jgi:hypothetical protein
MKMMRSLIVGFGVVLHQIMQLGHRHFVYQYDEESESEPLLDACRAFLVLSFFLIIYHLTLNITDYSVCALDLRPRWSKSVGII